MNGRKYLVGLAAGAMVFVGVAIPAFAADPTPTATPTTGTAYCQPGGFGMGRGGAFSALEPVAKLLGIQPADVAAQRQAGQSLAQIAQAKGVSEDKVVDTILAERKATLDARVKAGTLTAEQEKLMLDRMQSQVKTADERTSVGPMGPADGTGLGRGPNGRGMRQGGGQQPPGQGAGPRMGGGFGRGMSR